MHKPPVTIEPSQTAQRLVLWLHGLGADGYDFVPVIEQLQLPKNHNIRFLLPHAPIIPVTINGAMEMPAWYDILAIDDISRELDHQGIEHSCATMIDILDKQHQQGIAWSDMVIAGFSQGGVIASGTALRCHQAIAGVICLSTYFPFAPIANKGTNTPAFVGHGRGDGVVPWALGERCSQRLEQSGYSVDFRSYDIDHSVCLPEIKDISQWLLGVFHLQK